MGAVPGLDTLSPGPQTDAMRSTISPDPDAPECGHEHVEKDDDGRDYWFWVCSDCDQVVVPERDEDGNVTWEVFE